MQFSGRFQLANPQLGLPQDRPGVHLLGQANH